MVNLKITGNGKMVKNGLYLFKFRFFHQSVLIKKGKHGHLSGHDYFDYKRI